MQVSPGSYMLDRLLHCCTALNHPALGLLGRHLLTSQQQVRKPLHSCADPGRSTGRPLTLCSSGLLATLCLDVCLWAQQRKQR